MKIEWIEAYSVHVSELDEQHKKLIQLVTALDEGSKKPDYVKTIQIVLDELMAYVLLHFHTEEAYLQSAHYENLENHKILHRKLAKDVNDRVNEIIAKEPTALDVIKLHNFLTNWVNQHILEEDQKYVESLKVMHDL